MTRIAVVALSFVCTLFLLSFPLTVAIVTPAVAAPEGQLTWGHGPRVQESGLGLIPGHAYSAPYEDVRLKK